jgi:hypothetical protein
MKAGSTVVVWAPAAGITCAAAKGLGAAAGAAGAAGATAEGGERRFGSMEAVKGDDDDDDNASVACW